MDNFKLTETLMDEWGLDLSVIEEMFGEGELDDNDEPFWMIDGTDTDPADGIPDIIASLVTTPHVTTKSQGGAIG